MKKLTKEKSANKTRNLPAEAPAGQTLKQREPTEEEVRCRAYDLYLARGAAPDHELDDWLQAVRELRAECGDESRCGHSEGRDYEATGDEKRN